VSMRVNIKELLEAAGQFGKLGNTRYSSVRTYTAIKLEPDEILVETPHLAMGVQGQGTWPGEVRVNPIQFRDTVERAMKTWADIWGPKLTVELAYSDSRVWIVAQAGSGTRKVAIAAKLYGNS